MQVRIVDNQWMYLDNLFPEFEDAIDRHFQAEHPRKRYLTDPRQQSWDGIYRKYMRRDQKLRLPFLQEFLGLCEKRNIPIDIVDLRSPSPAPDPESIGKDLLKGVELEDYQLDSIKSTCEYDIGIHKHVTGAGKTEMMAGIAKVFNCPTVIIAEQRIVIEQIKERLELRDVIPEAGLFYGGSTPNGHLVVVGSIQSLTTPPVSLKKKQPDAYKKRYKRAKQFQSIVGRADLLLVDEVDKATSKAYQALFRSHFQGRRKYGFSGTPFDKGKPVEGLIVREHLGSIISQSSRKDVEAAGRIIPIKFVMVAFGEDGEKNDKTAFDIAEREIIIDNVAFHEKVKKIVSAFPDDGTLILVDTSNVTDLGHALQDTIPDSVFIYGKTTKKNRRKALDAFEAREIKCLIGGRILKRGLDLDGGAENLIILGGGKLWSDFDQKLGRAVRRNSRGWARVFSFLFLNNHYLYKHSREHLKAVVDMGYSSKVIFSDVQVDGAKFIKSRFRKPKPK